MYAITGGAGFIGSALVWELNRQGISDILVVDHLSSSEKWRNLVNRHYADYMSREKFLELLRKRDLPYRLKGIIHLGACSSTVETNCDFLMENNYHYSCEVCKYALDHNIRFISASSAATYGDGSKGFSDNHEGLAWLRPLNMYGYSKHLFDLWLLRNNLAGKVASLKFFNVFGPNEYHKGNMQSVVAKAYDEILRTGKLSLFSSTVEGIDNGEQKRDFIYVKDCTSLIFWLMRHEDANGILNVGTGKARSFNDLAKSVFKAMDKPCHIEYIPMPESLISKYQNYTCADMHWLREYNCEFRFRSLEEGVDDYVKEYLSQTDRYL